MAADPVDALDIALRVAAAVESLGGAYFVAGLGASFWSALVQALQPDVYPAWTRQTEAGLRRLGSREGDTPAGVYQSMIAMSARIRRAAPNMTPLYDDHFLSLVSHMKGRQLFAASHY